MDPASIIGLVGSVVGVSDIVARSLKTLVSLRSSYKSAELTITVIIGQLTILKAALSQVGQWTNSNLVNNPQHGQLVHDVEIAVDSCKVVMSALEGCIDTVHEGGEHDFRTRNKISFVMEQQSIKDFTNHLDNQVNALNLLLTAIQCRTVFEQNNLLRTTESRNIIKQVEEDKSSLLSKSKDTSSLQSGSTETSSLIDRDFEFDPQIFNSRVYRSAVRSALASKPKTRRVTVSQASWQTPGSRTSIISEESAGSLNESIVERPCTARNDMSKPLPMYPGEFDGPFSDWEILVDTYVEQSSVSHVTGSGRSMSDGSILSLGSQLTERGVDSESVHGEQPADRPLLSEKQRPRLSVIPKRRSWRVFSIFSSTPKPLPNPPQPPQLPQEDNEKVPQQPEAPAPATIGNRDTMKNMLRTKLAPCYQAKVLLLGSGASGKTTLLKSLQKYSHGAYTASDREAVTQTVVSNVIDNMWAIIKAMDDLDIKFADSVCHESVNRLHEADTLTDAELALVISQLWGDAGVRKCYDYSRLYQLDTCAAYFFDNVERILRSYPYIPTDEDILRSRIKTTGIYEVSLTLAGTEFKFCDTGGERAERKKWVHSFENAASVVFLVDISAYDLRLYENNDVNRLAEDLLLFEGVCNSRWFARTQVILLFTKTDVLKRKLSKSSFSNHRPDFTGDETSYEEVRQYITKQFLSLNKDPAKSVEVLYGSFFEGIDPAYMVVEAYRSHFELKLDVSASDTAQAV